MSMHCPAAALGQSTAASTAHAAMALLISRRDCRESPSGVQWAERPTAASEQRMAQTDYAGGRSPT
jgi:hypothetical protein